MCIPPSEIVEGSIEYFLSVRQLDNKFCFSASASVIGDNYGADRIILQIIGQLGFCRHEILAVFRPIDHEFLRRIVSVGGHRTVQIADGTEIQICIIRRRKHPVPEQQIGAHVGIAKISPLTF